MALAKAKCCSIYLKKYGMLDDFLLYWHGLIYRCRCSSNIRTRREQERRQGHSHKLYSGSHHMQAIPWLALVWPSRLQYCASCMHRLSVWPPWMSLAIANLSKQQTASYWAELDLFVSKQSSLSLWFLSCDIESMDGEPRLQSNTEFFYWHYLWLQRYTWYHYVLSAQLWHILPAKEEDSFRKRTVVFIHNGWW